MKTIQTLTVKIDSSAAIPNALVTSALFSFMRELEELAIRNAPRIEVSRAAQSHGLTTTIGGHHIALYAAPLVAGHGERFGIVTGNFGDWL